MADVVFKRGTQYEIDAVPITDGQILWDTTNGIIYMDDKTSRKIYAVGGADGVRPVEYGGTGAKDPGSIASSLKLDTLDASSVTIPEGANLNNYNKAGVYTCQSAGIASSLSNCPFKTGSFVLVVRYVESTSSYVQWLIGLCETATYIWYVRNCVNGTYCAWRALCDTAHTHGSITSDGRVGYNSGYILTTTTNGLVQAVSPLNARYTLGMSLDNLTNVTVCASTPTSLTNGSWYLVRST